MVNQSCLLLGKPIVFFSSWWNWKTGKPTTDTWWAAITGWTLTSEKSFAPPGWAGSKNYHVKSYPVTNFQDGDKFWKMPECYIRGTTIKYLRIPDEVIDMVKDDSTVKNRGRDIKGGRGGQNQRNRPAARGKIKILFEIRFGGAHENNLCDVHDQLKLIILSI